MLLLINCVRSLEIIGILKLDKLIVSVTPKPALKAIMLVVVSKKLENIFFYKSSKNAFNIDFT